MYFNVSMGVGESSVLYSAIFSVLYSFFLFLSFLFFSFLSFPFLFSFLFTTPNRGNVLTLSEREKNCCGLGSESIKLIDGLMLQTTYETEVELEVFSTFKETEMPL